MTHLSQLIFTLNRIARIVVIAALASASPFAAATLVHGTDTLRGQAYDTWQEPSDTTWRFACQSPCPIPLSTLQAAANGFLAAKPQLLNLSGIDTVPEIRPVDIFFESNSICPLSSSFAGYSSIYFPHGDNVARAFSCLFLWNYQQSGQINYFTAASAGLASSQTLIVHEYAHSIFYRRHVYSYEDFVRYWSYRISGGVALPQGMCSQNLVTYNAPLIYQLCQQYAADDSDLKAALATMDQLYQQGLGYNAPRTSVSQLRKAFDDRLGVNTASMWLGLGYAPQEVGGTIEQTHTGGFYNFDFELPNGSFKLHGSTIFIQTLKLEQPSCLPSHPFLDFALAFDVVSASHVEGDGIPSPELSYFLGSPAVMTYSYAHEPAPAGVNQANYRLYRATASCSVPGLSWEEVTSTNDTVNKVVTANVTRGGTYALLQPERIFSNGFD